MLTLCLLMAATLVKSIDKDLNTYSYEYEDDFPSVPLDCDCGRLKRTGHRIVGGVQVKQNELPFMALLQVTFPPIKRKSRDNRTFRCGGTLINRRYILTARHCAQDSDTWAENFIKFEVSLGLIRADEEGDHVQKFTVRRKNVIFYPRAMHNYTMENDILLLRLDKDVRFTQKVHPACLPKDLSQKYEFGRAMVAGWGSLKNSGRVSSKLWKTTLDLYPLEESVCMNTAARNSRNNKIPRSQLCAYRLNRDSCTGDSGGPLVKKKDGRFTVIGLVSYGDDCGKQNHAGIYTRVTSFMKWINKVVEDGWCGVNVNNSKSKPLIDYPSKPIILPSKPHSPLQNSSIAKPIILPSKPHSTLQNSSISRPNISKPKNAKIKATKSKPNYQSISQLHIETSQSKFQYSSNYKPKSTTSKLKRLSILKSKILGQMCDMTCIPRLRNLTTLDSTYSLNEVFKYACYKGQCYAKDGSDFCTRMSKSYPCGNARRGEIGKLKCKYPCNLVKSDLQWFINRYHAGELPKLINLKVHKSYYADCDLSTGYCCPYTPPGKKAIPGTDCPVK